MKDVKKVKGWQCVLALCASAPQAGSVWCDVMEADRKDCETKDHRSKKTPPTTVTINSPFSAQQLSFTYHVRADILTIEST